MPYKNQLSGRNRGGRPKSVTTKKFSTEPKSLLIAQLLKKAEDDKSVNKLRTLEDHSQNELDLDQKLCSIENDKDNKPKKVAKVHNNPKQFSCDFNDCTYSCKLSSNLLKHRRRHSAEKPYICEKCPFRSSFVNSLKVHQRLHTDKRPFECKQCRYKCNSSSNLKKHCRYKHS